MYASCFRAILQIPTYYAQIIFHKFNVSFLLSYLTLHVMSINSDQSFWFLYTIKLLVYIVGLTTFVYKYFDLLSKNGALWCLCILSFSCMIVEQVYNSVQLGSIRKLFPWPRAQLNIIVLNSRGLSRYHMNTIQLGMHQFCLHNYWNNGKAKSKMHMLA